MAPRSAPTSEQSAHQPGLRSSRATRKHRGRRFRQRSLHLLSIGLLGTLSACQGDRLLLVESVPPGATVRLDDRVVGRTPLEIDFAHYGQRRLALYRTGYRTHVESVKLRPRWWSRFPIDILTEVVLPLGLDDVRERRVVLVPDADEFIADIATEEFVDHALRARAGESLADENIAGKPAAHLDEED